MAQKHTEGAFQLHPPWNHPCVPHWKAAAGFTLSHKPALQLNTLHSKYFTGCSLQLWVCISTIRPPCRECTSSSEQAEHFLYITHLFLIFSAWLVITSENPFDSSWIQALVLQGCFLHSGTEWKSWAGFRRNADSIWALSSLDTRGRRRKGQVTGKLKTASKALKELIRHPSQIHFCNRTKINSGALSGDGAAEERLGRGDTR